MSKYNEVEIEEFRDQLQTQMREEYFHKLKNKDDPHAERYQLIATVHKALERLLDVEASFITEIFEESHEDESGICPNCLINNTVDLANVKAVATLFNHYLQVSDNVEH